MMDFINKDFKLFYESPSDIPAPYHFEAIFDFKGFENDLLSLSLHIQYVEREDFTSEELISEGLSLEDTFEWSGDLPMIWKNRLALSFSKYKSGSCDPKDAEPFIAIEATNSSTFVPRFLEFEENLVQELMQAIFEMAEKEYPLFLGFQFKNIDETWNKYQGELSFANLNFTYSDASGRVEIISDWDKLQDLMNAIFIAEFINEKATEDLKKANTFSIFPGDGFWYTAGDSLRKPSGNTNYFDILEMKLRDLFQENL
jgi:hypothetical protein